MEGAGASDVLLLAYRAMWRRTDNLPPSCADCLEILGALTSWTSKGLFRPIIKEELNFYLYLLTPTTSSGYKTSFSRRQ
jgi:hypothetical protein